MSNSNQLQFFILLLIALAIVSCGDHDSKTKTPDEHSAINIKRNQIEQVTNAKPWSYWWWMGSAVDKKNIDYSLKKYKEAGIGGLHIVPIYGVKGEEDKFIDYLSPEWVEMLAYTGEQCKKLGLGLDMTLGTGWCFGGPGSDENTGLMYGFIEKLNIEGGHVQLNLAVESKYDYSKVQSVMAVLADGSRIDISDKVDATQRLSWEAPQGKHTLYIHRMHGPTYNVKRPAPGGEGFMLDPFSPTALDAYTHGFDTVFQGSLKKYVRSIYHDSYEYGADWTHGLFDTFLKKRGYDLRLFMPELTGEGGELSIRVIADYRQTMAELHEEFVAATRRWADANGLLFRDQGHGSPCNWLDIYAQADIPETEAFGATEFKIPGFTRDEALVNEFEPNRFVTKFASSAAHVMGKPLVSSESATWLREHFRVSLAHVKPEMDQLLLAGVNHIFYHGIAYSPQEAEWPGWLFYASTNFAPSNSFSRHFPALNKYVERCQTALREGDPDNDILLYFPMQDVWHTPPINPTEKRKRYSMDILYKLSVHNIEDWLKPTPFYKTAVELDSLGYAFDYVSDKQLLDYTIDKNSFNSHGNTYKTLIIPKCEFIPVETMQAINILADAGERVIFLDDLPQSVPGYFDLPNRQSQLETINSTIKSADTPNIKIMAFNDQSLLKTTLSDWDISKEEFSNFGIPFIRRKTEDGHTYFISNVYSGKDVNDFMTLGVDAVEVVITDPLSGKSGKAILKEDNSILLQLAQGQSLIIRTINKKVSTPENWHYIKTKGVPVEVKGTWNIEFIEGGPELPDSFSTEKLKSWTENADKETKRFAGTARYSIEFDMKDISADDYRLSFEKVKESAEIRINNHVLPVLFSHPFSASIGDYLKEGTNKLEIEVANLSANRVRDLDKRGVDWKKYHDINYVNIDYKPFDASSWDLVESGLIGKVNIIPVQWVR